jgi:hypothetical protein
MLSTASFIIHYSEKTSMRRIMSEVVGSGASCAIEAEAFLVNTSRLVDTNPANFLEALFS